MMAGSLLSRPPRPISIVRVCWETPAEDPVENDFNFHLCEKPTQVPQEIGDMEFEWNIDQAQIVEEAGVCDGF